MDYNELINTITKRVQEALNNQYNSNSSTKTETTPLFFVVGDNNREIISMLNNSIPEFSFSDISYHNMNQCKGVIFSNFTIKMLTNLHGGIVNTRDDECIVKLMLSGTDMLVLNEFIELKEYQNSAPKNYYMSLLSKIKDLKNSDVSFLDFDTLVSRLSKKHKLVQYNLSNALDKKVVNQKDVEQLFSNGITNITVAKRTIFTDLAKEFIKTNSIQIIFN